MTSRAIPVIVALILAVSGTAFGQANQAAKPKAPMVPAVIAIVDFQFLQREAKAARHVRDQLEGYRASYAGEISKREDALRANEQELKRQPAILSPEAFAAQRREFEDSVAALQREVQERTRRLERSYAEAMEKVNDVLGPIIDEMAQEYGFTIVLDRSQVRYVRGNVDVTKEVLTRLDKRMPTVTVPAPDPS
jgi:outer membrane protein